MSVMRLILSCVVVLFLFAQSAAFAVPPGFVTREIPIGAPTAAVTFDDAGMLYVVESAVYFENATNLHVVAPSGMIVSTATITGEDPDNFFVGGVAYDFVDGRILVTDNAGSGRLYSFDEAGNRETIADGIQFITDVAVRSSGEIFVSTATTAGEVLAVDRATGSTVSALGGLAFGAGLAFEADGDLVVQDVAYDAQFNPSGSLRRLPISESESGLQFGAPEALVSGANSSYGVVITTPNENEYFATGRGGLYRYSGTPLGESLFAGSGGEDHFSSAIAFHPGVDSFAAFAGAGGGKIVYAAQAAFGVEDDFLTVITPAEPTDFNSSGLIDLADLEVWAAGFGMAAPGRNQGDANADGAVTGDDFLTWQRSYQQDLPPVQALFNGMQIPEPNSMLLFAFSGAIFLARVFLRVH